MHIHMYIYIHTHTHTNTHRDTYILLFTARENTDGFAIIFALNLCKYQCKH